MRIKNFVLFFLLLFNLSGFAYAETTIDPSAISGQSAILIEESTGKVVYQKNGDVKVFPASTTKIMTALLSLENLELDKKIKVPENFQHVDGSSMYLLPGEEFTVRQLIEALLIHSANDSAELLAMQVADGDIPRFAQMMNDKAKEIGCKSTHFVNPHGLHDPQHYTTAHDMALIAREALKNPVFREIVKSPNLTLPATPQTKEKRIYNNTNKFLWSNSQIIYRNKYIPIKYNIVEGVKTGYTPEAGNCLVSVAYKNGIRFISAVYKSNGFDVYRDSRTILDYGYDNFNVVDVIKKDEILGEKPIKYSVQKILSYGTDENILEIVKKGENPTLDKQVSIDNLKLPIKAGDKVGTLTVTIGDNVKNYDIVAKNDMESIFTLSHLKNLLSDKKSNFSKSKLIFGIIILIIIFIVFKIIRRIIRKKRRRNRYKNLY